jgi:menaquinone-dependent protoporphyrinogen oxidase
MKILICYASTDGQTRKISRFCADQFISAGHSVEMLSASDANPFDLAGFDAAVLAGSVHIQKLQSELTDFATDHAGTLNAMPTLFLQVSLAAAGEDADELADLDRIAQKFCTETGFVPGAIHHVAGAFRFTEYDFFRKWAMRFIAAQKGEDIDPNSDKEFTDWAALAAILKGWPPQ